MPQTRTGGCYCGAVKFSYTDPSLWSAHCHCTMCRRSHGAAYVTWVGVSADRFELTAQDKLRWYESSPGAQRGFCDRCGSTIFFQSTKWPGEMHIVRSNIDGDVDREPTQHGYWETHVGWADLGGELPKKSSD